jgi:hypothetical protein
VFPVLPSLNNQIVSNIKNMTKHLITLLVAGGLAAAVSAPAQSTLTWDWTITGTYGGSGTLTTQNSLSGSGWGTGYLLTDMTGTYDGQAITGVWSQSSAEGYDGADELITTGGGADNGGILFFLAGGTTTTGESGYTAYQAFSGVFNVTAGTHQFGPATFSATIDPVPEPGTFALAGMGMAVLMAIRRRK